MKGRNNVVIEKLADFRVAPEIGARLKLGMQAEHKWIQGFLAIMKERSWMDCVASDIASL